MRKHNGMRPQDIAILLKIVLLGERDWQFKDLSQALYISGGEITASLNRSRLARLVDYNRKRVNRLALFEFLQYGLPFVFPDAPGAMTKGMPTAHSHPILQSTMVSSQVYVWPDIEGKEYGQMIEPLYNNQVKAAKQDPELYAALAMTDVIRIGKTREINFALTYLSNILDHHEPSRQYNEN